MEQSVGRKVVKLKAIDEKEAPEKFMHGERKTLKKECKESNGPSSFGDWSYLLTRKLDLGVLQESVAAEDSDVGWGE